MKGFLVKLAALNLHNNLITVAPRVISIGRCICSEIHGCLRIKSHWVPWGYQLVFGWAVTITLLQKSWGKGRKSMGCWQRYQHPHLDCLICVWVSDYISLEKVMLHRIIRRPYKIHFRSLCKEWLCILFHVFCVLQGNLVRIFVKQYKSSWCFMINHSHSDSFTEISLHLLAGQSFR